VIDPNPISITRLRTIGHRARMSAHRPAPAVWAGLATIYVVWGSTYLDLGIRTIPPLLMMSARHVMAGSILAYTVYLWLLRATRTSLVATYAFVNPVVALLLGSALLGERIGTRTALASAAIVAAVALTVAAPAASSAAGKERRRVRGIRERPEPGVPSGEPG
jgi:drug/metabolite transporter (DMT)-like permease